MSDDVVITAGQAAGLATGELRALVGRVARPGSAASEADLVDRLDALERLKAAAAAAQADLTRDLDTRRTARAEARARLADPDRPPTVNIDAGLAGEVALARRESPHQARGHLRLARRLHTDLPHTYAALQRGDITERRAMILATETHDLSPDQRRRVDAPTCPAWATPNSPTRYAAWCSASTPTAPRSAAPRPVPGGTCPTGSTATAPR